MQHMSHVHVVEAQALINGFQLASRKGILDFILELDNLEVIKRCHVINRIDKSPVKHLIGDSPVNKSNPPNPDYTH